MVNRKAQDKLIVVKHKPGIKRKRRLMFITGLVVMGAACFWLGEFQSRYLHQQTLAKLDALSIEYRAIKESDASLRQQVANLESGRAIDGLAKQEIQEIIRSHKAEISQLETDVSFYQQIMAPSNNVKGLQVQKVELKAATVKNHFAYKIVLAQVADNKAYVKGLVAVNLIGMEGDKKKIIPLRDISEQEALGIKFKFKYFQEFSGELVIPDGLVPENIQVVAQSKGKKASRIEQSFEWKTLTKK
ncbi:MAG: cell division protein FtsB [Oleiphilaceae bacterium]|jgi:cell division protein FtsB